MIVFIFQVLLINYLVVVGLHHCTQAFSSCCEQGLIFVVVWGLLVVGASRFGGFSCGGSWVHGLQ